MAEYIEREAAMQAFLAEKPDAHYPGWYAGLLEELPAADVAPVVRCKDCERWQRHTQVKRDYGECRRFSVTTKNDDFCSRGERRG